ncbi:hypothetical protein VB264_06950 [Arcicella aquatica]|uniref:Uncharacterized protein n=1 Tax=Arcicella aquatica TaxID=217141 RepID=A0ABU5QKE3_9BACT|nr:hypothetical protein [Arcicella aquatica]MEA5257513.1 hypothetical protein [Arcicella aquatica]
MANTIHMNERDIQTLTFRLDSKKESLQKLINFVIVLTLCCVLFGVWEAGEISFVGCLVPILFGLFLVVIFWYTSIKPIKNDLVEQKKYVIQVKVLDKIHHDEFGVESWKIRASENEFGITIIDIPNRVYDDIILFSQIEVTISKKSKEILDYQQIKLL